MAVKFQKNDETLTYERKDFLQHENSDFLRVSEIVMDRWKVIGKLGEGSYGKVYAAHDNLLDRNVAIKCSKRNKVHLLIERDILLELRRFNIVPKYIAFNIHNGVHFLVSDLQGPTLSKLKEFYNPISLKTALSVGLTTLQVLCAFHERKYIHGDVKPSNIVIGNAPNEIRNVLLIDCSLARKQNLVRNIKSEPDDFCGTIAYAGPPRHLRKQRSELDDFYSLLYTVLEIRHNLPWKYVDDKEEVLRMKLMLIDELIRRHLCSRFLEFKELLEESSPDSPPKCKQLEKVFLDALKEKGFDRTDPYEWELNLGKFWRIKRIKRKDKKRKLDPLTGEEQNPNVSKKIVSIN